ncbi:MAG: hypothetical protein AAF617_13185 [Bacteroidota bacterium]
MSLLLACIGFCCLSCSNDDTTTIEPDGGFYALKVGNSWVYEYINRVNPYADLFNGTNIFEETNVVDSVKVVGTEEIDGNTFYKFRIRTSGNDSNYPLCYDNGEHFEYFRDSLGYLINQYGKVKFAVEGDTQEFLQVAHQNDRFLRQLSSESEIVSTPVGDFDCFWMELYVRNNFNDERSKGTSSFYYKEEVGLVFSKISWANEILHRMERRLVSYDVQ